VLLQRVGLGGDLVGVGGHRHESLREALLQILVLVREDAGVVVERFGHAQAIIQDDERKEAAMVLI
jgi:hypothetical protein